MGQKRGFLGLLDLKEAGDRNRKQKLEKAKKKNKPAEDGKRTIKEDVSAWEKENDKEKKGTSWI